MFISTLLDQVLRTVISDVGDTDSGADPLDHSRPMVESAQHRAVASYSNDSFQAPWQGKTRLSTSPTIDLDLVPASQTEVQDPA